MVDTSVLLFKDNHLHGQVWNDTPTLLGPLTNSSPADYQAWTTPWKSDTIPRTQLQTKRFVTVIGLRPLKTTAFGTKPGTMLLPLLGPPTNSSPAECWAWTTLRNDTLPRDQLQAGRLVAVNLGPRNLLIPFKCPLYHLNTKIVTSTAYVETLAWAFPRRLILHSSDLHALSFNLHRKVSRA